MGYGVLEYSNSATHNGWCEHPWLYASCITNGHILSPFILHVIVVDMGAILCQMWFYRVAKFEIKAIPCIFGGAWTVFDQVSPWAPCRVRSLHHRKPKVLCSGLGWVVTDDLEHVITHILLKVWRGPFHVTILVWYIATKNCVSWVWANGKWAATQFTSLFVLDHVRDSLLVS